MRQPEVDFFDSTHRGGMVPRNLFTILGGMSGPRAVQIIEVLCRRGANPNFKPAAYDPEDVSDDYSIKERDAFGLVEYSSVDVVKALLKCGADPKSRGASLGLEALVRNTFEYDVVKCLLDAGVVPRNPATFAALARDQKMRDLLKRYGYT